MALETNDIVRYMSQANERILTLRDVKAERLKIRILKFVFYPAGFIGGLVVERALGNGILGLAAWLILASIVPWFLVEMFTCNDDVMLSLLAENEEGDSDTEIERFLSEEKISLDA